MELEDDENPAVTDHDFSIISFYNSEDWSQHLNSIYDKVRDAVDEAMASGEWKHRDIGFFRVNIETHPELAPDDSGIPDQLVYNKAAGLRRLLHYHPVHDTEEENIQHFVGMLRELTGDWVEEIACEDIQRDERYTYDEVVYFGDADDLGESGKANLVSTLSMVDRYSYDQSRAGFFYNSDPACRKEHDLDEDKNYVVYFNGLNALPQHLEWDTDQITYDQLLFTLNTSIVKGTPIWGQRSYSALYDYWMNGIVFLLEKGAIYDHDPESYKRDWRMALMARLTEYMQENDSLFVPIVQHFDEEDEDLRVPALTYLLDANEEDVPHIYLLHSMSESAVMYPEKLDDVNKFTPELIMAWAEKAAIEIDLANYKEQIVSAKKEMELRATAPEGGADGIEE